MALLSILAVALVLVLVTLVVMFVAIPRRRRLVTIDESGFPRLAHLRRVTTLVRILGFAAGLIAVAVVVRIGELGLGLLLAPAIFAALQILAVVVADLIARRSATTPGVAGLEVRSMRAYLPRALGIATLVALVALALTLGWSTAVGSADDMGRAGRSLSFEYPCDGECFASMGPWPGSYYSIPLALSILFVIAMAVAAASVTVRRPRDASNAEIVRVDDLIRSRATESAIAAVGFAVAGSLMAVCVLVSRLAARGQNITPLALLVAGWAAVAVAVAAFAMSVWCAVVLLLPGARMGHAASSHRVDPVPAQR